MRRLLKYTIPLLLLSCSGKPSTTTPKPIKGCQVPRWPTKPRLSPTPCGEAVCLSPSDVVALVKWEREVELVKNATQRCSLIEWVAE